MLRNFNSFFLVALSLVIPAGSLVIAGCSKGEAPSEPTADAGGPGGGPGGRMGGPGGGPGGGRMGGGPVPVSATGAEIFDMKCQGCHGSKGEGRSGPNLTKVASAPDAQLIATVKNGKGRMPALGNQMTEAQVKEVVAYVKTLGAPKV